MLETGIRTRRRRTVAAALALLASLYGYTGLTLASGLVDGGRAPVVIGAKTFTEQYILSEILARHITAVTGEPTRVVQSLGSTVAFDALAGGDIDVYVDYSGTLWATVMQREGVPANRQTVLEEVTRFLRDEHDIVLVGALGFENAYALAMRGEAARELHVERISQLTPLAPRMTIGGDYEFFARPEWKAIQASYGLAFASRRTMDASLMYQAVAQGSVDVISAFSTDGRIAALDLRLLADDRAAIPPYDAVILAGPGLAARRPGVMEALGTLTATIDAERMRRMNRAVDDGGETAAVVARRFLGDRIGSARFDTDE
jgi:osmoprotectant transport system permease protein